MFAFGKNIHPDLILPHMKAISQKQAFQVLAREAAPVCGLPEKDIEKRLAQQERKQSSGIGDGVAIPHLHFRRIDQPCIVLARLDQPIEYEALDGQPVDLICMLLAPIRDGALNLQRLAFISRMFRNARLRERLREAQSKDAIKTALLDSPELMKAA